MATIRRRKPKTLRRKDGLLRYARNETSQGGEDGIVKRLFELLPSPSLIESGIHLSNTYQLLVANPDPWRGVLVEADAARYEELSALHAPLGNLCVCRAVSCVADSDDSLLSILSACAPSLPHDFDFATIDVDGTDYWLMADLLSSYRPKCLCVEFNPTIPNDLIYIQPRDDAVRQGSSLAALVELASSHQYTLVETTIYNAFFVPDDLFALYIKDHVPQQKGNCGQSTPDTSIEALHEVTMGTSLYQLYDGTLKLHGCKKLLWHRKPINEADIQVLSAHTRSFPFKPGALQPANTPHKVYRPQPPQKGAAEEEAIEEEGL